MYIRIVIDVSVIPIKNLAKGGRSMARNVAVVCKIRRGAFSDQRIFQIALPTGAEHVGAASVQYFVKKNDRALEASEPPPGKELEGKVAARIVDEVDNLVITSLPDGEVVTLEKNQLGESPGVLVEP
jgi:hypothetical protein